MKTPIKYLILSFFFIFVFSFWSFSQTFEEFKKNEAAQQTEFKRKQQQEMYKLAKEFDEYVRQADKEFANYLKREWESYQAFQGLAIPELPKPTVIPVAEPDANRKALPSQKIPILIPKTAQSITADKPLLPVIQKSDPPEFLKSTTFVNFFSSPVSVEYDREIARNTLQNIDEQSIANWWTASSNTNYVSLVNELLTTKNKLSLNDWAYFLLVNKTAEAITPHNLNNARLLSWFIMIRSGFNIKVAFDNDLIYLLFPSENKLYGKSYLMINNQHYYFAEDVSVSAFQTYDFNFSGGDKFIDFTIYQPLNIGNEVLNKNIKFTYQDKEITFPLILSVNTLEFFKTYPVTELSVFFNATMSRITKESLAEGLMPFMHTMSESESLNFLLGFVQNAFTYKTDQEQFNKEKFFFPEEVFYYSGSDCEDRAALFTYLVKQFLHLDVIGLEYTGHVATAVRTTGEVSGDFLLYDNQKYTIADPTYVNAPLGLTMPKYKNQAVKIVQTSNTNYLTNLSNDLWSITNSKGGFRGNNLSDSKFDSQGNGYLTGYYTDEVTFGDETWYQEDGKRQPFIIKFNKDKEVVWAKKLNSNNFATGFSIALDKDENPIIAGSFSGNIIAADHKLSTANNTEDIFIAAYNSSGDLKWLQKSGLNTADYSQFLNYVINFSDDGRHLKTNLYIKNPSKISNGIFSFNNSIKLVGELNLTFIYNTDRLAFETGNNFNTITYLKEESDALINKDVSPSIAGLLAVINLIKSSGMVLPGVEAQKALDKYNPGFKISSPSIYSNIGKVSFIKNNGGVISIETSKNNSVSFDKIKISNGAKLKITSLQNGREQIDILNGIEVGKAFIWYNLSFVQMVPDTGDLLFDYDTDHTQKVLSMKKDILK
ncbi:MAG: hypothetical protein RBR87_03230 [Bacteroidales bacterium]|jgi:hypothetical protein|nr:hypothetical protein [Bacteroidales bacterium]